MGQGKSMQEAMDEVQMVVEGVYSAKAAARLAEKYDVSMPIVTAGQCGFCLKVRKRVMQ